MDNVTELVGRGGGWIAALALVGVGMWRSFAVGQRVGRVEATQQAHGEKLDYLIGRLDAHIDKGVADAGPDHH